MSRYRLMPTPSQEITLARHCAHARYVWNLAVEQHSWWRRGRGHAPGFNAQCAQLTEARATFAWLADGSHMVQQQALQRRLARARKGSRRRGRVKAAIARLKARERDRRKDWAEKTSTGVARRFDVIRIEELRITSMARSARGTVERPGRRVRQKAGLNRSILASGWGLLARRLEDKAPGRVEKISPAFTSQRCSACGTVDGKSRESQADFVCRSCGYSCNADLNAAKNIAAGHAVTARGRTPAGERMNREPQLLVS